MDSNTLDGNRLAKSIRNNIKKFLSQQNIVPSIAIIIIGNDGPSKIYVSKKNQDCKEVGIKSTIYSLEQNTSFNELANLIKELNADPSIHGMILQLPLPPHLRDSADQLLHMIDPLKDIDGFHPYNIGALATRHPTHLRSCTPKGIMNLLASTKEPLKGKQALVVGASNHVGRPIALELLLTGCTVTIAHRFTTNLNDHIKKADILISAVGKANLINDQFIKDEVIAIDVGITTLTNGSITGDLDFPSIQKKAKWITPVPGGVGPMTRAMLLENALFAYYKKVIDYASYS